MVLADDVGVWFGAVIRGDNEPIGIGVRTTIQEATMLHSDPRSALAVGMDVTAGHRVILHGCTAGDNALIGMGATVLSRARIIANALVTEGKGFPDLTLAAGASAKVARTLDSGTAETVRASAVHHVVNRRRFAAGLRPIA